MGRIEEVEVERLPHKHILSIIYAMSVSQKGSKHSNDKSDHV